MSCPTVTPPALRALAGLASVLILSACGGGAGGGSDTVAGGSTSAPAPVQAPAPGPSPAPAPAKQTPNQVPTASAWVSTTLGQAPLAMSFDGSASDDADGEIVSYRWSFGDGRTAEGRVASHTYDAPGIYEATLTVVDDDDATADAMRTITVQVAPESGFTVSGSIRIQASSAVDSDTNDPSVEPITNDDFDNAQAIATPTTLGGYLGVEGRGRDTGALFETGDRSDVFRLSALGGETITLSIAQAGEDLDLRLYDADRVQVDESMGIGVTEVLGPIAVAGDYYVQVRTFGDATSNYVLTVGHTPGGALADLQASAAFVPGEFIVGPDRVRTDAAGAADDDLPAFAYAGGRTTRPGREAALARLSERWQLQSRDLPGAAPLSAQQRQKRRTLEAVKRLRASGRYAWVEPNWIRQPLATPDDPLLPNQWHYRAIHLPQAWDLTTGDRDVVVAVIDTGILAQHPAFTHPDDPSATQLVPGYDFISDPQRARDGDGYDADPEDIAGVGLASASSYHGSHVAGIVAARTDDGQGVAGAGWNTRIMPLRVLGEGGGTSADLVEALRYAGGLPNASGELPERAADVINLSLGSPAFSEAERAVIAELRALGIIVIAAAGNASSDRPAYPAAYDGVVSVAATTINDEAAFYSNFGASIDVAAPGGDTSTDVNGDGIADGVVSALGEDTDGDPSTAPEYRAGALAGTSMAAPHVAGVAALMKAVHPDLTPQDFDAFLAAGLLTRDLGAAGRDDVYGNGLIDAHSAVLTAMEAAGGDAGDFAVLVASPASLNFGPFADALEFRVSNAGTAALFADTPRSDVPWLAVEPVAVDSAGLGTWRLRVDRDLLPADGIFAGTLRVDSDANAATLTVRVQRSSIDLSADAGHTYVVLTGEDGARALYRTTATARLGQYDFALEDVAPGRYRLYAGSDADHDDLICDPGESCGAWFTLDTPTMLEVDADIDGIEFITAFQGSLAPSGAHPLGAVSCPACSPR